MVTTRSQEKKSTDTPEPSIVVNISTSTEQQTPSIQPKRRSTPRVKASQDDTQKSPKTSAVPEKASPIEDDATPTANNKTVPIRQKPAEPFYTPAQTPANKRKRFTSEELDESTLDTFETPAEHPQTRPDVTIEEEHDDDDDDDAPEVVSSKTAAEQVRALRNRTPSSAGRKRRKTALDQVPAEPASDTIEVVSTPATPAKEPVQDEAKESDGTAVNDQPEVEVSPSLLEDERTPQTITVSETIIVETASPKPNEEDQTEIPERVLDNATEADDDTASATVPPTSTEELQDQPSDDQLAVNDAPLTKPTTADVQPENEPEVSVPDDQASSTILEHTSTPSTVVEISAQPTISPPPSAARPAPEPQAQLRHQPSSRSSLTNRTTTAPKPPSSILSPRGRVALLHGRRPQKSKPTSSLTAYRSRILNRHPRTSTWGAPGQRKVRFVGA
ncbi:hypothetical protein LTR10_015314 [Elasticomyces elasticus]|uniref:Shugoshin C-terminal domain-containing protein n=1 Tax=Exophiala sideris TaxID=1016849 RepID=A0ABR0JJE8_9EURO|nr:hypothetical protein LTR10_015314 [Elasticomyces elasticus]KAK5030286.1 hypothetical protein LTR13_008305 [Exophiala sideris]KAK5035059.1 hypothetical protein LTS07_002494 [Exophiala sideris]KAK5065982.1 hypothetical protein LTR69_002499 [Exophiala sideris]KAK5178351.1 hypothetical protein LTR44_009227 [Eurotiomycetes sp. CCFEE 6388]